MELIKKKVSDLIPYINNSRIHSEEQITQLISSIKEFGFTNPILLSPDNSIIAGHGRLQAIKRLGHEEVPCIIISGLTKTQIKALIIADNQLALNAGWDLEKLSVEVEGLKDEDFNIDILGFEDDFIKDLLNKGNKGLTDEDEVPEVKENPKSKLGDLWLLKEHRLVCGDSINTTDINKLLNGLIPNAIVTDPPYGIGIDGQKKNITNNPKHNRKHHEFRGWDSKRPDKNIFNYIIALNIPTVIWGGNYFADLLPATRGWLYWNKGQDGLTMSDGELAWTTENKPLRSKTVNRSSLKGSVHPTQKPVDIINFSIEYLKVPQKGSVLDLFGGSGTTLICCEKSDKKAFIMELDPMFCDVIIQRWQQYTGKEAIHEQSGKTYNSI